MVTSEQTDDSIVQLFFFASAFIPRNSYLIQGQDAADPQWLALPGVLVLPIQFALVTGNILGDQITGSTGPAIISGLQRIDSLSVGQARP